MKRNRFNNGGDTKEEKKSKIADKSIVVSSFEGIADIYNKTKNKNTTKNTLKKNPSYYDDDKSDGITIDKNGNVSFHGKKGLKVMKQRQKDGLSITNVVKPRTPKSK